MKFILSMLLLVASPAWALDFKGVTMGQVASAAQVDSLTGWIELEGQRVQSSVYIDGDGKVAKIEVDFRSWQFDTLVAAARRKWGKPTSAMTMQMQNGFGAAVANPVCGWDRDGWSVKIFKHVDMENGWLVIAPFKREPAVNPASRM